MRRLAALSQVNVLLVVYAGLLAIGGATIANTLGALSSGALVAVILPVLIAQTICVVALLRHERRRVSADRILKENQENMSFAAKAAKLVLWSWDVQGKDVWVSEANCPVFGSMSAGSKLEDCLEVLHPADRAPFLKQIEAAIESASAFDLEYRVVGSDERVRWVKTLGHAEVDAAGRVVKLSGGTVDITERKEIEFEAAEQREILAHAARVGVLGELSGAIAHELSQPLAAILSNAQAAQRVLERTAMNSELKEIVSDIIDDNKRARDVISHLRTLLKKGTSETELLDINEEVREALALAHSELIRRRVDVSLELDPRLPPITGDRIQLEQVLLNLVLNAAEAINSSQRRGHLTIATGFGPHDGAPQISVRDNGPGLSKEAMSRLFEPFFSTKVYGLGLGLAICKSIVAAHAGRLWAVNNPEGGATFFVSFPSLARKAA